MLDEIQLFIACRDPKVWSLVVDPVGLVPAIGPDNGEAALLAKWRICQHHFYRFGPRLETVANGNHWVFGIGSNPMKKQIHSAQARYVWDEIDSVQASCQKISQSFCS